MQFKVYQEVIEDVISGVREYFLESGVEEHVLQDLKQAWESKLLASKAVSHQKTEGGGGKKLVHTNEGRCYLNFYIPSVQESR